MHNRSKWLPYRPLIHVSGAAELAQELGAENACGFAIDISNEKAVVNVIDEIFHKFGTVHALFCNAGILLPYCHYTDVKSDDLYKVFNVNTMGAFFFIQNITRKLIVLQQEELTVLCTSSIASIRSDVAHLGYSMSKALINSMVKQIQDMMLNKKETRQMRINAILPAGILTSMAMGTAQNLIETEQHVTGFDYEKFEHADPLDIAEHALFLLSSASSRIKGQCIVVDGGLTNTIGLRVRKKIKKIKNPQISRL